MPTIQVSSLRPLLHPILVHFPIALLLVSVALDWVGYWLRLASVTRAGFYTLVLGAAGAGIAALAGPDGGITSAAAASLLASHQTFALITVAVAVSLMAVRFLATDGIQDGWALVYLACTLALVVVVSLTGYYGGELTYHQGVGVTTAPVTTAPAAITSLGDFGGGGVHAKPFVALIGLLTIGGLGLWLFAGRWLAGPYAERWWAAMRRERSGDNTAIWTLQRTARRQAPSTDARSVRPMMRSGRDARDAMRPTSRGR